MPRRRWREKRNLGSGMTTRARIIDVVCTEWGVTKDGIIARAGGKVSSYAAYEARITGRLSVQDKAQAPRPGDRARARRPHGRVRPLQHRRRQGADGQERDFMCFLQHCSALLDLDTGRFENGVLHTVPVEISEDTHGYN